MRYEAQVFDSRNTAVIENWVMRSDSEAVREAASTSTKCKGKKVSVTNVETGLWSEYENGVLSAWSYPKGLHE